MQNLVLNFENIANIRTIIDSNGEPLFVARDIATFLGYEDTDQAIRKNCKNPIYYQDFLNSPLSLGKTRPPDGPIEINDLQMQTKLIREPDIYALIFRSKLESAERFRLWVYEEVLPSIRKTGKYSINQQNNIIDQLLENNRLLIEHNALILKKISTIEEVLVPKAQTYDLIVKKENEFSMEEAAKLLNQNLRLDNTRYKLSNQILLNFLREGNYISSRKLVKQEYINRGYFTYKFSQRSTQPYDDIISSILITTKGLMWIIGPLKTYGLLPIVFDYQVNLPMNSIITHNNLELAIQ